MELSVTTTFTFTALRPFLTAAASVCREVKEDNKAEAIRQIFLTSTQFLTVRRRGKAHSEDESIERVDIECSIPQQHFRATPQPTAVHGTG